MAFLLHKIKDGHVPPWEWLPTNAATYQVGDAGVWVGGYMTTVAAGVGQDTDEGPHYICMADGVVAADGGLLPWIKCEKGIVFRTTLSAADADLAAGLKYCIHTDGRQHDGTTTKGVFLVESFDGTAAGDYVYGEIID
ncbi:MAG: hypothetical protein ACYCWE_20735 [Eubacteriales bacterium]